MEMILRFPKYPELRELQEWFHPFQLFSNKIPFLKSCDPSPRFALEHAIRYEVGGTNVVIDIVINIDFMNVVDQSWSLTNVCLGIRNRTFLTLTSATSSLQHRLSSPYTIIFLCPRIFLLSHGFPVLGLILSHLCGPA